MAISSVSGPKQVVVIGGGVAGLLSAAAAAKNGHKVIIIDKPLTKTSALRDAFVHLVLPRGGNEITALLPNFEDNLLEQGGQLVNWNNGAIETHWDGYKRRTPVSGRGDALQGINCSREMVVKALKEALKQNHPDTIELLDANVRGLTFSEGNKAVTGVKYTKTGNEEEFVLDAGLVIDAGGRDSKVTSWIKEQISEFSFPKVLVKTPGQYTSYKFEVPLEATKPKWNFFLSFMTEAGRAAIANFPKSDILSIALRGDEKKVPRTKDDLIAHLSEIPGTQTLIDFIESFNEPNIKEWKNLENKFNFFSLAKNLPSGLVSVGDTSLSQNPTYGRGMTLASMGAGILNKLLGEKLDPSSKDFSRKFHRGADLSKLFSYWLTTYSDIAKDPGIVKLTNFPKWSQKIINRQSISTGAKVFNWFMKRFHKLATTDKAASDLFGRLAAIEASPVELIRHPITLTKILLQKID